MSEDWPTTDEVDEFFRIARDTHILAGVMHGHGAAFAAGEWDAMLARQKAKWQAEAIADIRPALDRWEADGDDERLVNEVLDPLINRIEREAGLTDE